MEDASMTAKVSAFSRAYHASNNMVVVFDDPLARRLLGEEDYEAIARNMTQGIGFFNPGFSGNSDEALRWIVDNQLAPSVLERAVFAEEHLRRAVAEGATQYLIFGAGYDTFAYRRPEWAKELSVFEIDRPSMVDDKRRRLDAAGIAIPACTELVGLDLSRDDWPQALEERSSFESGARSFCSLLGVTYYLGKGVFSKLLGMFVSLVAAGSELVFDYPALLQDERGLRQEELARGAGEQMQARYSAEEIAQLLANAGLEVIEDLPPDKVNERYFSTYNAANPEHPMGAFPGVNLCCARVHEVGSRGLMGRVVYTCGNGFLTLVD